MYLLQNGCILASTTAAGALLWLARGAIGGSSGSSSSGGGGGSGGSSGALHPVEVVGPYLYWPLMAATIAVGSSSSVGSVGAAAAVEREWVKVLCGGDALLLARANSGACAGLAQGPAGVGGDGPGAVFCKGLQRAA
jgi:hypothetical protein